MFDTEGRCPTTELFFARVVDVQPGRLKEPPLLYSSRLGWRIAGDKAREPGTSVRDALLERLAEPGSTPRRRRRRLSDSTCRRVVGTATER